ncbi:1-acyl-sn-glycerol-3-phosphate acyltransferase [Ruegeria sp. 2012CJ41-6]|uniref:Glycerol-3-phosphate acyltransferase n=1 Tax=Ruegeria spongiae TaxID=2942209 RepID=A0ABT0PZB9_9RHOB|nr:1-acyl-sn-glycerol-3-phosphate acyltransferase [Ruegeria spongiae]MCL6282906.1 1-acyl-sn-glycerol-3-phosphate acyltransferase [Ruegeria spongiae]
MTETIEMPLWLLLLILGFAIVAALDKVMFPSVRWFFRRRLERAVARLNQQLTRPIQPFKLMRRHDMMQHIIYDPEVGRAVQAHAHEHGIPEAVASETARKYAREIVPSFSAFAYFSFAIRAARLVSNALFRVRLSYVDAEALRSIPEDTTVVFVMNHRSNMDYVLVTYLAADQSALSYAVGEWARVWPLSRLIRAMGAYFIRRKSRSDLYRHVLACYVRHATEAGVTQAIFPEGGLSLTGGMGPPKLGLLKYMIDAAQESGRDVVFVPVAINYDRVLEDTILTAAASRNERRFRARIGVIFVWMLKQIWQRILGRFRRFGFAAVSFGEPVSLGSFEALHDRDLTIPLARELSRRIGALVPVLPVPLAAWLMQKHGDMTRDEVVSAFARIFPALPGGQEILPTKDIASAAEDALQQLVDRRMLICDGDRYRLLGERADLLAFYACSVAHLLEAGPPSHAVAEENAATAGS